MQSVFSGVFIPIENLKVYLSRRDLIESANLSVPVSRAVRDTSDKHLIPEKLAWRMLRRCSTQPMNE